MKELNSKDSVESLTAEKMLKVILNAVDCNGSVSSKFTHFDGFAITKDFFAKKKTPKTVFTNITKRNIAEIIYCALGIDDCVKESINKDFFKPYSKVQKEEQPQNQQCCSNCYGIKKIKFTQQYGYTCNLLESIKWLCGTNYEYSNFIDLIIEYHKFNNLYSELDDLQKQFDAIAKIIPKTYNDCIKKTISNQDNCKSVEKIRQFFLDKKYDEIAKMNISEELKDFHQFVINSNYKTVADFLKGRKPEEIYDDILEKNKCNYKEMSEKYSKQISSSINSKKSIKLFKAIMAYDICKIKKISVSKKLENMRMDSIDGKTGAIRRVIIDKLEEAIKQIRHERILKGDYYIRLFLYTFYVFFMKSINDESNFHQEAINLFESIMGTLPFYNNIYKKTDEIICFLNIIKKHTGNTLSTNNFNNLKKLEKSYVKEVAFTSDNSRCPYPIYQLIRGLSKDVSLDAHDKMNNLINGICDIIIERKQNKTIDQIYESIVDFVCEHYPFFFPNTSEDRIESYINGILSVLINNDILSISFNKKNLKDTAEKIFEKVEDINYELDNITLSRWIK